MGTVVSLAIYDREQCWPRWSGTIGELQDAAELAATEIQEWTGEDPEISIRVVERGGLTVTLDQHTELPNAVDVRDLPRVKILSIEVGRYGMARAEIRLEGTWLGAGMRLSVRGGDRTRVEGLTRQLSDALTPRYSVGVPGLYGTRAVIAFNAAFVATLTVATLAVRAVLDIDNIAWRLVIIFGSGALVTATTVLAAWAGPSVEILEPGQRPRYLRWRGRLLALVGTLTIGIAASVIAAVLYSAARQGP